MTPRARSAWQTSRPSASGSPMSRTSTSGGSSREGCQRLGAGRRRAHVVARALERDAHVAAKLVVVLADPGRSEHRRLIVGRRTPSRRSGQAAFRLRSGSADARPCHARRMTRSRMPALLAVARRMRAARRRGRVPRRAGALAAVVLPRPRRRGSSEYGHHHVKHGIAAVAVAFAAFAYAWFATGPKARSAQDRAIVISYLQAAILGLLQGVAEPFPVSSLGHGVILPRVLGWDIHQNDDFFLSFLVATHLATALVLLGFFWEDWKRIVRGIAALAARARDPRRRSRRAPRLAARRRHDPRRPDRAARREAAARRVRVAGERGRVPDRSTA